MKSLFHYTSVNNLALILQSKTIRFNRLDKVNDPTEGLSNDFQSMAPYIFVSCWTANTQENLALWNMYTPQMRGVRIQLNLPIFNSYEVEGIENLLLNESETVNENIGYFAIGLNDPLKLVYTDDPDLLSPPICVEGGLHLRAIAKHKRKMWSFEEEYRYRLDILPLDKKIKSENFPDRYQHLITNKTPAPIEELFIKIEEQSFETMEIVSGPKMIKGDLEIIQALINTYNTKAKYSFSELVGLIR
ncbi:hypothetical protein BH11BAC2_BH11BAC2_10450 [soil metagenome]